MDWFRYLLSPSFFHYAFYKALFSNLFIAEGSPRLQQGKAYTFFLTILRLRVLVWFRESKPLDLQLCRPAFHRMS